MKISGYFWPQKLFTRTLLLVSTIMILSYLAAIILMVSYVKKILGNDIVVYLSREIRSVQLALDALPESAKVAYLHSLRDRNNVYLYNSAYSGRPPGYYAQVPIISSLAKQISRSYSQPAQIRVQSANDRHIIWVKLHNIGPNYWYGVWLNKNQKQFSPQFIVQMVLILILSVLAVLWISYRLNKPFKRLSHAAKKIGQGETPVTVPVSGVREVKELCRAFNSMGQAISQFEADRALMLAGISHDLRTPLARIRLAVEILNDGQEQELKHGMILDLDEMDAIIGQFLTYVDQANDEQKIKVNVNEFIKKLVERYSQPGNNITVKSGANVNVYIKPVSLQRIINNLIDNALRYAKPPIVVQSEETVDKVKIFVKDSGPGIPDQEMERLCQPFTRSDSARSDISGAGLGLAIVQRIAKANAINVLLENQPQGGLSVCLEICK